MHEYRIKVFHREQVNKNTIEAYLNSLASDGWRVVGVVMEQPSPSAHGALIYTLERKTRVRSGGTDSNPDGSPVV